MAQIRFSDVGRQYGDRWVVRSVDFHVSAGDRWGVVGRNGVGKTTLFRLLAGEDEPTEGEIWRHPGLRFTHLRQDRGESSTATVMEAALEPFAELRAMERRMERDAAALADVDPESDEGRRLLETLDHHQDEFRRRGGYEMSARAEATLEGLSFPRETWDRAVRLLSGGELGRLRLAQTLLAAPDVLLLDEPTNHLDLRSTEWLEAFLRGYPGTVLLVSHDRVFLRRVADHVLHLEGGTGHAYDGGFDAFVRQREERRERQRKEWEAQQSHVARTEEFIRRNLAGQKTKQAKSRRTQLERLERVDRPADEAASMAVRFGAGARSGGTVLKLDGVSVGHGERVLLEPFSAEVRRDERIAIVGPNGCGKSTLIRALAGEAPPLAGSIVPGTGVRAAYYRQDLAHLDPDRKIWEEVSATAPSLPMPELRGHLARFLFSGDEIEARVGDLSGGEQARVALAKITLERVNLLLLDEPTNHLDLESREALEAALRAFSGTIVLISHDRAFLSALATRVWAFRDGEMEDFAGGFDEWRERDAERGAEVRRQARAAEPRSDASSVSSSDDGSEERPALSKNEVRRREREMRRLEERVEALESRAAELEAELADPALYGDGADPGRVRELTAERDAAVAELEAAMAEWERVGEELAGV